MERYIVFVRKVKTGEEFVSARMGQANEHNFIMGEVRQKYAAPQYEILTAYTEKELADIVENVRRWGGPAHLAAAESKVKPVVAGIFN